MNRRGFFGLLAGAGSSLLLPKPDMVLGSEGVGESLYRWKESGGKTQALLEDAMRRAFKAAKRGEKMPDVYLISPEGT